MKIISDEIDLRSNNYCIKEIQTIKGVINNCSWRRAKKLALRLHIRGSHKKKNPKWVGLNKYMGYSRRNRRLHIRITIELSNRSHEIDL